MADASETRHRRSRYNSGLGTGARHDRRRPDDIGHLHRQAIRLGRPARAAVSKRDTLHQVATDASLSTVWLADGYSFTAEGFTRLRLPFPPSPFLLSRAGPQHAGNLEQFLAASSDGCLIPLLDLHQLAIELQVEWSNKAWRFCA